MINVKYIDELETRAREWIKDIFKKKVIKLIDDDDHVIVTAFIYLFYFLNFNNAFLP